MFNRMKSNIGAASLVCLASVSAQGAIVSDDFEYEDQVAFESVYAISTTTAQDSVTLDASNPSDKNVELAVERGTGRVNVVRQAETFILGADDQINVSLDVESANSFQNMTFGIQSASDASHSLTVRLLKRTGNGGDTRVLIVNDATDATVFEAAGTNLAGSGETGDTNLDGNSIEATWRLEVTGAGVSLYRDDQAISSVDGTSSATHGLDLNDFTSGAKIFFGSFDTTGRDGVGTGNFDNLSIEGVVPEPSSIALFAAGGLLMARRRGPAGRSANGFRAAR